MTGVQTCALPICFPVTIDGIQALTGEALIAKIKQGDSTLGESEIQRAQKVYQEAQASGDTERANLAHKWANRIREAMGVSSQYDPTTGASLEQEGTNIPESTYTGDTGGYDFSDIDNADYGIDSYDYGGLSSGLAYSGEDAYSGYDTTWTDTYNYQGYTGTASAGATITTNTTYRDWETDRKSTRLNSSHRSLSRMPSSA